MKWLGDPGPAGPEACIIDLDAYRRAYPDNTMLTLALHANWYDTRLTGAITVTVDVYEGGTLNPDMTVQIVGTVIETASYTFNVASNTATAVLGDFLQNIEIDPYGEKAVTILNPGTCTINADQGGNESWNPALQVQQSFVVDSPACILCSMTQTSSPVTLNINQTGVVLDNGFIDAGAKGLSCVDWETNEIHQFWYSTDNKLWLITSDLTTKNELRRVSTPDMSTIIDRASGTGLTSKIAQDSVHKCPGTDWIIFTFYEYPSLYETLHPDVWNHPASMLSMNTVTGEVTAWFPESYPITNTITGFTSTQTIGIQYSTFLWAKPLGTNSGKTLACSVILNDYSNAPIQRAGYGLFIIDNITGVISCIAYGDFGDRKSSIEQYNETSQGLSVPTVVGSDYTEFVYSAPKYMIGVDDAHWADTAWVNTNYDILYDDLNQFSMYFYTVRVTTSGTITYEQLALLHDETTPTFAELSVGTQIVTGVNFVNNDSNYSPGRTQIVYVPADNTLAVIAQIYTNVWQKDIYDTGTSAYVLNNTGKNTGQAAVFKINLTTPSDPVIRTNIEVNLGSIKRNLDGTFVSWLGINNPTQPKLLVGESIVLRYNADLIDTKFYVLDCETLAVELWLDDAATAVTGVYGTAFSSIGNECFVDIPNCRLIFCNYYNENPSKTYYETQIVQFTSAAKKLKEVQYVAVKVRFPTGGLPADAITNVTLNTIPSCTIPDFEVFETETYWRTQKTTGVNVSVEVDSNSIYIFNNNTSTWVQDTSNQVSFNNSIASATLDYSTGTTYYVPTFTFADFGYNIDFTIPGSLQKFTNGNPFVYVPLETIYYAYCLADVNNPGTYVSTNTSYAANGTYYDFDNPGSIFNLNITLNGNSGRIIGSAIDQTGPWRNVPNLDFPQYRQSDYMWMLYEVEVATNTNAPCAVAEQQVLATRDVPPSGSAPRYAIITIYSESGVAIDTLSRKVTKDYQPVSNYVGKYSADFGNTHGDGMYIDGVLIARWGGDTGTSMQKLYVDLDALRSITPVDPLGFNREAWFELRANFQTLSTNMYVHVDKRIYGGGTLDPVTLMPIQEGEIYGISTLWAPVFATSATSTEGEALAKVAIALDYWDFNWWRAYLQAVTTQLYDYGMVNNATEVCGSQPVIGSLPSNYTRSYITNITNVEVYFGYGSPYFWRDGRVYNGTSYPSSWQTDYGAQYIYNVIDSDTFDTVNTLYYPPAPIPVEGPWLWSSKSTVAEDAWYGHRAAEPSGAPLPQTNLPAVRPSSYSSPPPIVWKDYATSGLKGEFWALPVTQSFSCYSGTVAAPYTTLAQVPVTLDYSSIIPSNMYIRFPYYSGRHTIHKAKPIGIANSDNDSSTTLAGYVLPHSTFTWILFRMGPNESNF